jgi:hypothetical protein
VKTLSLTQVAPIGSKETYVMPWQRLLQPGDYCVFPVEVEEGVRFVYFLIKEPSKKTPDGFLLGDCFSELSPSAGEPEEASVHPSEIFQPINADQFEAARRSGFRSEAFAVMRILNYSDTRGEA